MKNRRDFLLSGAGAVGLLALSAQAKSSPQQAPAYLKVSSEISQTGMASIRSFLPTSFNASDPSADCTKYIQNAINERVQLFLPAGVYNVAPNPDSPEIKNAQSKGGSCINLLPGCAIIGVGTIRLLPGSYSGVGSIITNWDDEELSDVIISGVRIDGNSQNVDGAINCINIIGSRGLTIDNVNAINPPARKGNGGIGIGLRSSKNNNGPVDSNITNCRVENCGYIGISIDRPNGVIISSCTVDGTNDNGIDIFGNDYSGGRFNSGESRNVIVSNSIIKNAKGSGIFLESCGDAVISVCHIDNPGSNGIILNRMNSASLDNVINAVKIKGNGKGIGVKFKNTTGSTQLSSMRFENLESSYHMDGAEFVFIDKGIHKDISGELIKITNKNKVRLNSSLIERQVYQGGQQPRLIDTEYSSALANTTTDGIHWLNANKVL
ncbi:TPA: right-handed parallel beta-helix repeat-containing protein [Klebsiella pneumoniae]|nr:right-handed parallel beta-helix repeat-containing protein [Klebsiella pneumoniae]HCB2505714.1 right-handed parallel beta-helix repeat-containing protein [Klebsiella pneumoniae]HDQ2755051.1 right-handed parallel beta-helix repeat-containing protein [Klebsiella pneumoniae]